MKNIFLVPTNKATIGCVGHYKDGVMGILTEFSEVIKNHFKLSIPLEGISIENPTTVQLKHIYITSDEDVKDGDWCLDILTNSVFKNSMGLAKGQTNLPNATKKIILTTDPKLIDDGVQYIDEDFLKWFVRNSGCEFVRINDICDRVYVAGYLATSTHIKYEITIPQEVCNGSLSFLHMISTITEEYECVKCGQKYRYSAKNGSQNFFPLTRCTKGVPPNPLDNLEERFKRDMSMVVMPLDNENIPEEEHSYLQGFINQFGTGVLGELDPNEWDALGFLEWLKLNNYEIIKKK